jgi:hypothetical protein
MTNVGLQFLRHEIKKRKEKFNMKINLLIILVVHNFLKTWLNVCTTELKQHAHNHYSVKVNGNVRMWKYMCF